MGCCESAPEVTSIDEVVTEEEKGVTRIEEAKDTLTINEQDAVKAKADNDTFIGTVLKAREAAADNPEVMKDACTRLQAHNRRLKEYIAIYDSQTVNEAMNGGFLGLGCNDRKLIAALCTRTKSQLQRTRKQYRDLYDKDLRAEVQSETGGSYGKMMFYALASPSEYIADIIDVATGFGKGLFTDSSWGCDETALLEVFVLHTQEELQEGKKKWEGRTDKKLIDFLNNELGSSYRHLRRLLFLLMKGDRNESEEVDEELAATQVEQLKEECDKGWFEDFDESLIIETIGANTIPQNQRVATLYENKYEVSLYKDLKGKCGDRLHYCLAALMMTKPDFVAMRLHDAMKGWFNDNSLLTRFLGGLDGPKMAGAARAYEEKYSRPLWSALKAEISGDFERAAQAWIQALEEPSRGAEAFTDVEVDSHEDDAPKLAMMLDWLLVENESLLVFVAYLDVETIREATKGWGTDDTALIRAFATRSKRALARVNIGYRNAYGEPLQKLIDSELGTDGYYGYLAKFLVVQEEQADSMILDLAMDGPSVDHQALVEFLCARHPKRVRAAKQKWEQSHDDSLVDKLADSLAGEMRRLALKMLKGKRDDVTQSADDVDDALARKQAHQLHDGAVDYIEVLCDNSPAQNAACARYFEESYDMSLRRAISQEYSGPVKNALLALLSGPSEWYAAQLKAAFHGMETNDKAVCRIIGAHDKPEIKAIAAAYDKKYGDSLKQAISRECQGNYKRLAVAWVDLIDQLEQPNKKIDIPSKDEVPDDAGDDRGLVATVSDDFDISEDDDDVGADIKPSNPLYRAKLATWTVKYQKYRDLGKKRKYDHYQRLLVLNPPIERGHKILKGYADALSEEYKGAEPGEDWTMMWLNTVEDSEFDEAGTTREVFKGWLDVTESMVAEKLVTINELKSNWGCLEAPAAPPAPVYAEPAPLALPVGVPAYPQAPPVAHPAYAQAPPVAHPAYGTNYPQAQPAYPGAPPPTAYPGALPVAQPGFAQPAFAPYAPPIYGGPAPPIYGGPAPPIYGAPQTTTYSSTTTTTSMYASPVAYPQTVVYR